MGEPTLNPKVLVTRKLQGPWREMLERAGANLIHPRPLQDEPIGRERFLDMVKGCHGVGTLLTEKWDKEAFDVAGPQLRVIANYAAGYDNIDLEEANRRGVYVTNTPDALTEATADIAWSLIMMTTRRLAEAERDTRAGKFEGWGPNDYLGVDLVGKTIGIIGAGLIGTATARRAVGWHMRVIYYSRSRNFSLESFLNAERVSLEYLLRESDIVSLHCPITPDTHHLIGEKEISLMKSRAVLVNTARGPVIDEKALVNALQERRIFAAGLDVYENEPELTPGLTELDNVVLLPHIGSATRETRTRMAEMMALNLIAGLRGKQPPNLVNNPKPRD